MRSPRPYFIAAFLLLSGCTHLPTEAVCRLNLSGWQGSGTLVAVNGDRALILSCRHVNPQVGAKVKVTWPATGEVTEGVAIAVVRATGDFQSDLAFVMSTRPQGIDPVEITKFDPSNGPWTCLGYKGEQFYVSIARTAKENGSLIELSAPLTGGMSGGCCLDRYNRLVGVGVGSSADESVVADGDYLAALVAKYSQ
jgi:hypothetical protein